MTVKGNLEDGKNIVDATVDPMVGIELLYPEAAKRFGGKGLQNALGRALALGRYWHDDDTSWYRDYCFRCRKRIV